LYVKIGAGKREANNSEVREFRWPWTALMWETLVEIGGGKPLEGKDGEIRSPKVLEENASSGGEVLVCCVWHDDRNPSLSVNLKKGVYNCFSESCAVSGSVYDLVAETMGVPVGADEVTREVHTAVHDWLSPRIEKWHWGLVENRELVEKVERERGILEGLLRRYKIGWVPEGRSGEGWVMIPIMSRMGQFLNVKMHRWPRSEYVRGPKSRWLLNTVRKGSGREGVRVWDSGLCLWPVDQVGIGAGIGRLWVLEGELDCLAWLSVAAREKKDLAAVSVTGGAGSWSLEHTKLIEELVAKSGSRGSGEMEIVFFFDGDESGRKGVLKAAKMLDADGVVVKWVDWAVLRDRIKKASVEVVGLRG